MESKTVYFDNPGKENTDETLRIAKQRANELGIKTVIVASTTGFAAVRALDVFKDMNLIVVSHSWGWKEPNVSEFTEENRKTVKSRGVPIITAAHVFGGLCRAMRQGEIPEATATYVVGDVVATTLRIFGQGMKVVCEIATMAADAGLVRNDEEVICVAGVGKLGGADTAVVIRPEVAHRFFDMSVKEVLCKPRH